MRTKYDPQKVGLFSQEPRIATDHGLLIRIIREYPIGLVTACTTVYRQHATNILQDARTHYQEAAMIQIK
jgi:hypothetical protein